MQMFKRIAEQAIDYLVPVICAAAMLWVGKIPGEIQHWIPVGIVGAFSMSAVIQGIRTRHDVRELRKLHADDAFKTEAMRAQLDDAMGKLYASCVVKGYTTEEERRVYQRMEDAYEGIKGNGEAKRRAAWFFALMPEEEWQHLQKQ